MGNEKKSIHDFDYQLICEYYSHLERQGPGSEDVTLRALSFIDNLHSRSAIADIGCGTGGQTITLAKHAPGKITGIDLFPLFIDFFNRNARQQGLQGRMKGIVGSMDDLPFRDGELDLIWSVSASSSTIRFRNSTQPGFPEELRDSTGQETIFTVQWKKSLSPCPITIQNLILCSSLLKI